MCQTPALLTCYIPTSFELHVSYDWQIMAKFLSHFSFSCICYVQTLDLDNPWVALHKPSIHALRNNPWIVSANCGSTLYATQSQAPQTKGAGYNHKEGLRSATQGDVRDSYLGLGILHCIVFGVYAWDNPWIVCAMCGSTVCAGQSMDCPGSTVCS